MKPITHTLSQLDQRRTSQSAFKFKKKKAWIHLTWKKFFENCSSLASYLLENNIQKGDRIAIISNTRYEWAVADMTTLGIGAVTVPIYQSNSATDMAYILNNSEAKILFCENEKQFNKWQEVKKDCPHVEQVILFEGDDKTTLASIMENSPAEEATEKFKQLCKASTLEDTATLIYTSGTTGAPKGVVLTHKQIASEVNDAFEACNVTSEDCSLSFLPYAHVMGRMEMWGSIERGFCLAFAESIEKIKFNLQEVKPTFLIAVPRIFEKIHNGIVAQVEVSKVKSSLFSWALELGKEVSRNQSDKKATSLLTLLQYQAAKKIVLNTLGKKMGGRLRFAICGGAPLAKEISEFFHACGLLLLEGYGLTETSAAVCLNTPLAYKFGSVGQPLGDTEIKIAEDGEILIKSDKVMKEYYKNEEATNEVFEDGYFKSGDIGELDENGFLKITDRKKDLIKTAGGKYVAPQRLENLLKLNPYVSNVLIHGDQKKYIVALLTPDEESLVSYAKTRDLSYASMAHLTKDEAIAQLFKEAVAEANSQLASFESIKNFAVLDKDFTVEDGELTPSMKVKRKFCDQKYKDAINKLYGTDRSTL